MTYSRHKTRHISNSPTNVVHELAQERKILAKYIKTILINQLKRERFQY